MLARFRISSPAATSTPPIQLASTGLPSCLASGLSCSAILVGSVMACGVRMTSMPSQTILGSPRGLGVILPLRQHIGAAGQYRRKFVLADMPVEDFFEARGGIEAPLVSVFDDGDGRRPIVVAYQECELGVTHFLELVRLLEVGGETLQSVVVLHRIAGQQFGAVRTEDGGQRRLVIRFEI